MADKFLYQNAGVVTEKEGLVESAGAGDAGKIPALDSTGRLDDSVMPVGIAADVKTYPASEALGAGDYVNIHDVTGTLKVRKADASTVGKQAHGYVLASVEQDATATVYFDETNNSLSGLTGGPTMYLSATTAGAATATAPTGTGKIVQILGIRLSATELNTEIQPPIVLA